MLLFARNLPSQMDVLTRSSYVMTIVPPEERAARENITLLLRSVTSAASPLLAAYLFDVSGYGWPLVMNGRLKIVYDLLKLWMFCAVRPPEEVV